MPFPFLLRRGRPPADSGGIFGDPLAPSGEQRGHDPFPHDARVVRPRRELLPDVAPFIERDGVESREVALEREQIRELGSLGYSVDVPPLRVGVLSVDWVRAVG